MKIINKKELEKLPHPSDIDFIKNKKKEVLSEEKDSFVFVPKPWGFEYLCFRDANFDIWELHLYPHASTSSHLHTKKDVLVLVLEGTTTLSMTNHEELLSVGEVRIIKQKAIHQFINTNETTTRILEIESPPDRHDLIRIKDNYGRAGMSYATAHNQLDSKSKIKTNHFFSTPLHGNEYYEFFELLPGELTKKQSAAIQKISGIIFKKDTIMNDSVELDVYLKTVGVGEIKSFLVLSGTVHIPGMKSHVKKIKSGECFVVTHSSKIIRVEKDTTLVFWN
jgi:mannose-6-phosphate isomerase-like protein (cupin superfamily)